MAASVRPSIFIRRPILSSVISIIITLAGAISMTVLPVAQYPDLVPPSVNVQVFYPGASAETISQTAIAPLEVQINGVENMLYMASTSSSGAGMGTINVYFSLGTNPDMALVNVNNKVNLAQTLLPQEVRNQGISVTKRSPSFLQLLCLYSSDDRYSDIYLANYLEINILDEVKRVAGVGDASTFGPSDYSMRVWLKPDLMGKYGLTVSDVAAAIAEQNQQFAPGRLGNTPSPADNLMTWQIDSKGRLTSVEEFENIIIRTGEDSSRLLLKDIARVELGSQDYSVAGYYNGHISRQAGVYLLPGANAIATGNRVTAVLDELRKTLPDGMILEAPVDTNEFVMESIKEVIHTLVEAMILVFLVVFLFLQNWRATLIPCIAVPVSVVGTFAGMLALGYSINTLTLFGLVLAIGIVVDDAIVVLENVERIMSTEHLPPKEAAAKAMHEVTSALIAIVLVLCSVFIPVSFMGGLAGQMYKQFAITISVSVVLSGIVALTLTPALCAILLKPHHSEHMPRFFVWFNYFFTKCTHGYVRTVRSVKNSPVRSMTIMAGVVAALVWLASVTPTSMVPNEDQGYGLGLVFLDDGASQQRVDKVVELVEKFAEEEKQNIEGTVVINGFDILSSSVKSNYATFFFSLQPWEQRKGADQSVDAIMNRLLRLNAIQPSGVVLGFVPPPISGMSTTGGFEGYVQMRQNDTLDALERHTNELVQAAMKRPEIGSAQNLFTTSAPQIYANLDRERCKDMGISIADAFTAMQGIFGTYYVNDFNYVGRTFQVRLQAEAEFRTKWENINDVYVRNSAGEMLPLSAIMTLERRTAPQAVDRYNVFPAARVMGNPAPGYTTGQALQAMEEVAAEVLPAGYSLGWAGSSLQEKLASADTAIIFVMALVMVFLILAAQYESWSLPLAVLTAVPFGVLGAFLATWARDLSNDVYFQVALVTLIGLSAKNSILIVEFAVEAWREGRSLGVAAMHAARLRFRPIVMTSLAFILGVVPLAISTGAGANSRHAIGTAVIGGMLFSTCIATLFIPFFFTAIMKISLKLRGKTDPNEGRGSEEEEVSA
ncbi:hydrophobe/amphiphile efflux-1 family RND transporter [Desulfovibrio sp. An276]|uniref:efflux RND transporter permease subunit n=1 Tax=Desulfovibrio sp. An276 TaxID=1965618 RepID=UPI000B37F3F3|nr:multidrug efflux RND transporter permease subunit [Desulfovibrio sp. An276]OUO49708.1 hydrophobe/amphiphile efflux-1 family RND transporter [Desulfovibrio sp. An276]